MNKNFNNNSDKFLKRKINKPKIDNDFIKGKNLTNIESWSLMIQDRTFDKEEFEKAIAKYVKWK